MGPVPEQNNQKLADDLVKSLGLQHPPLAIHFSQELLPGVERFVDEMPAPTADGRAMTCAIPGARLGEVVQRIKTIAVIDGTVANYASEDTQRFERRR